MSATGLAKRIRLIDAHPEHTIGNRFEELSSAHLELLTPSDVVVKDRAREEERPVRGEQSRLERRHRARRLTERDHQAPWLQRGDRILERVLADGIVDDV